MPLQSSALRLFSNFTLAALVFVPSLAAESLASRAGPYALTLRLPPDGLFAGEEMEIEFRAQDDRGEAAPPYARFHCVVDMPSMPGMARFDEVAHREGVPGVFGVHPTFPHGGEYRLCITLEPSPTMPAGDPAASAEFVLDVGDAGAARRGTGYRPFSLEVLATPSRPVAGEPAELELRVRVEGSPDQREVVDFDLVHERPMHLFVVRRDLAYFAHEHPELVAPGVFRIRYRFPASGAYRLFADVAPKDAGGKVLSTSLAVSPGASPSPPPSPPLAEPVLTAERDGVRARVEIPEGGIPAARTVDLPVLLSDSAGRPVTDLEPWLGALAHLLLVHRDGETFAHAHPDEREAGVGRGGRVPFLVRLPKSGLYRGWLQFSRGGRVTTVELALETASP